jgi:murein L,D-transpeptidase YcbB/YkuD
LALSLVCAVPLRAAACDDLPQAIRSAEAVSSIDTESVSEFYRIFGDGCAWDEENAAILTSTLRAAGDHGLDPALFHAEFLLHAAGREQWGEQDVLLTDGAIKYAVAMTRGLSAEPPPRLDRAAGSGPYSDVVNALSQALSSGRFQSWLDGLPPTADAYQRLTAALATYRSIAEAGGWESMPAALARKKRGKLIPLLRRRLAIEGDLSFDDGSPRFDADLRAAVARFQARNGLRADGHVKAQTIERLNVSAAQRVAQISLNLERLRVQGLVTPSTRVEVNAPAAAATLYRDGIAHLTMNAVVGKPGHDTPTLSSQIDTIILNPQWTIPRSIIQNEIKPALKRNPDYLVENRMYWAGDQLIQEPGPHNALGRIKFDFPNRYSVYLHDTPARRLFLDPERAQSHGCVRLEKPLDLAAELLRDDPKWDREAITEAIREGATRRITLSEPMPVVITYLTVFVGDDGLVQFRPDIYGLDTQLTLALSRRATAMRSEPAQW